jgi:sensor domain CHASE-containing protein
MALVDTQELLLIVLVFVLALFLLAFVMAVIYSLLSRKRNDRLKDIEERLGSIENRLGERQQK